MLRVEYHMCGEHHFHAVRDFRSSPTPLFLVRCSYALVIFWNISCPSGFLSG